jgi:hypothetical protein
MNDGKALAELIAGAVGRDVETAVAVGVFRARARDRHLRRAAALGRAQAARLMENVLTGTTRRPAP